MTQKGAYVSKKKGAKKGTRKKAVDTFAKKEWFELKAPSIFAKTSQGRTLVTKSSAKQNLEKLVMGRCFIVNQADLTGSEIGNFRKFKFLVEEVKGRDAIGSFYSMELTTDKARGIVKKWHDLIEGNVSVKTTDGYTLRVFVMAQSKRPEGCTKARCYIQTTKQKLIRKEMFAIVQEELSDCDINRAMKKLCDDSIGAQIEKRCGLIAPLQNCYTKKVSVLKRPKKLIETSEEIRIGDKENNCEWE